MPAADAEHRLPSPSHLAKWDAGKQREGSNKSVENTMILMASLLLARKASSWLLSAELSCEKAS